MRRRVTVTATLGGSVTLQDATTVTVEVGASGDSAHGGTTDYARGRGRHGDDSGEESDGHGDVRADADAGHGLGRGREVSVEGTAPDFTVTGTTVTLTDDDTASTAITLAVSPEGSE